MEIRNFRPLLGVFRLIEPNRVKTSSVWKGKVKEGGGHVILSHK